MLSDKCYALWASLSLFHSLAICLSHSLSACYSASVAVAAVVVVVRIPHARRRRFNFCIWKHNSVPSFVFGTPQQKEGRQKAILLAEYFSAKSKK